MATAELIDLDAIAPPDRRVKLGGHTYRVPGDPPSGWLLTFRQLEGDADSDELTLIAQLRDALIDLFVIRQPDAEDEVAKAIDQVGITQLVGMVNTIYHQNPEAEVEADPPGRRAGTRNTRPRASSGSRSSAGSAS